MLYFVTASHTNKNDPLKWRASIQYEVLEEAHEVKISFLEPPKHHNFTQFIVKLENVLGGRAQKAIIHKVSSALSLRKLANAIYKDSFQKQKLKFSSEKS